MLAWDKQRGTSRICYWVSKARPLCFPVRTTHCASPAGLEGSIAAFPHQTHQASACPYRVAMRSRVRPPTPPLAVKLGADHWLEMVEARDLAAEAMAAHKTAMAGKLRRAVVAEVPASPETIDALDQLATAVLAI